MQPENSQEWFVQKSQAKAKAYFLKTVAVDQSCQSERERFLARQGLEGEKKWKFNEANLKSAQSRAAMKAVARA
jgi:hypothetical protein